ncbi:MAG: hypothetical protein Q8N88_01925 [Nanoarchaeota archaeon]|nr:hypothetical protein [Nanoarchaeota archaeon]
MIYRRVVGAIRSFLQPDGFTEERINRIKNYFDRTNGSEELKRTVKRGSRTLNEILNETREVEDLLVEDLLERSIWVGKATIILEQYKKSMKIACPIFYEELRTKIEIIEKKYLAEARRRDEEH